MFRIYAVCNVICRPIRSIFPELINAAISRDCHNQLIKPFRDYDLSLNDIWVMWTHTSNSVRQGWSSNHFVLCVDSDVLARGSRKSSCSYFESGRVAEQKPNENPSTSIMDDGDLNGKKSKLEDNGSPSNTSAPKKQKLDTDEAENLDHSAKWTANKSEVKESPGITSLPKRQKLVKDPDGIENVEQPQRWPTPDIKESPFQSTNFKFPVSSFGSQKRSFQESWYKKWKWLHYDVSLNAAFCFCCIKAYKGGMLSSHNREMAFLSTGFGNWKKATMRF